MQYVCVYVDINIYFSVFPGSYSLPAMEHQAHVLCTEWQHGMYSLGRVSLSSLGRINEDALNRKRFVRFCFAAASLGFTICSLPPALLTAI